jgi:CubicO group peptidase (beta-lactamase class C family)
MRHSFKILLIAFLAGIAVQTCLAQSHAVQIDSLMHRLSGRGQFNGSILVSENGRVIYENGFGKADVKNNIPFTPAAPCYLASLTKQFTAMAVMMLAEQGKLSYSDTLSKYFPEFPPYAQKITIRHLLNHTSGIPDYVRLGLEHPGLTNKEVLDALVKQDSLDFLPGEQFEYSNSGYVLLAMIIEKASGKPYHVFLKQNIFGPLEMSSTTVYDESKPSIEGRARGYSRFGDDDDYTLLTHGEGGIYSTVEDLSKWDQTLYTEKLVKKSTLDEAFTPAKLNDGSTAGYGFGWGIGKYKDEPTTSHAGRFGGFNTYIKRFLISHNAIIFLTNKGFKNMGAIGNTIINILNNEPYTLPKLSIAELMYRTWSTAGIDSSLQLYKSFKRNNDTSYDWSEGELNELGYELLGMNKIKDAIEILKLNAEVYPDSWNVYDGLGEAYMKNGDTELAIKNYRESLRLNPDNSNAVLMLNKLGGK